MKNKRTIRREISKIKGLNNYIYIQIWLKNNQKEEKSQWTWQRICISRLSKLKSQRTIKQINIKETN